jgi:hypothetical protein
MPRGKSWRQRAVEVLLALKIEKGDPDVKRKLFDAYPFGMRKCTPYKVWLEECHRIYWWAYKHKQKPLPKWLGGDG